MKVLLPVFLSAVILFSCSKNPADPDNSALNNDNYITMEATAVKDSASTSASQTWYNETYLSRMMEYSGLQGAFRFKKLGAFNVDFVPGWVTIFKSATKDGIMGLPNSSQALQANSDMAANWPDSQIVRCWNVSYEKLKSWENVSANTPMQYVTVVATVAKAEYDSAVNAWETNFHVPWLMKYKGLSRVVRYKKIDGTGANVSQMPKYIEVFYYKDKAGSDGQGTDTNFVAAEADRVATWQNGELTIDWVLAGVTTKEVTK